MQKNKVTRYSIFSFFLLALCQQTLHAIDQNLTADEYERIIEREKAGIRTALARDDFDGIALMYQSSKRWRDSQKEHCCKEFAAQPVHYAIHFKDHEIAKELVEKKKALLFQQDAAGTTPIVRAIYEEQVELLDFFLIQLEEEELKSVLDRAFTIAKQHAIKNNVSNSILSVIIHHILTVTNEEIAPLIWAIKREDMQAVHALLKEPNININVSDTQGNTALMYAVSTRNKVLIGLLAKKGAHCYAENIYHWNPVKEAAFNAKSGAILTILLAEHITTTDWARAKSFTPLLWAASQGDVRVMQLLIDANEKCVKDRDADGNNALYWASINGHRDTVRFLKESGVVVGQKNRTGWTPLAAAVRDGNDEVLSLLFDPENYTNERDEFGWTPLIKAARFNKVKCVRILLELGVDGNEQDDDGNTALHWAARYGFKECVLSLLEHGTDVNAVNERGLTPLFWACRNHHASVARLLLEHGAVYDEEQEYGWILNYSKITSSIKTFFGFVS